MSADRAALKPDLHSAMGNVTALVEMAENHFMDTMRWNRSDPDKPICCLKGADAEQLFALLLVTRQYAQRITAAHDAKDDQ